LIRVPLVESNEEIWDEIAAALAKGKVEPAAAGLRHHLEYASRHLANDLGATPAFHADGNYELGELLCYGRRRTRSRMRGGGTEVRGLTFQPRTLFNAPTILVLSPSTSSM
jgi:hypothetical protein